MTLKKAIKIVCSAAHTERMRADLKEQAEISEAIQMVEAMGREVEDKVRENDLVAKHSNPYQCTCGHALIAHHAMNERCTLCRCKSFTPTPAS